MPHRGERGLSLVEVLVATGVLVTGITALLQLFVAAVRANVDARADTFATVLALQKIEALRAGPIPGPDEATEYLDPRGRPVGGRPGALYERRWTVEPLPLQPGDTVVMTVRVWRHGLAARAVQLTTLRTRRGV